MAYKYKKIFSNFLKSAKLTVLSTGASTLGLILLCLVDAIPSIYAQAENEHRTLAIGESQIIEIAGSSNVNVSRKGIIDVQYFDKDQWQVTALKEGIAIISVPGLPAANRVFIQVTKNRVTTPQPPDFFEKICRRKGFLCDPETSLVQGEITDPSEFSWAKKLCQSIPKCDFQALLSDTAVKKLEQKLSTLLRGRYDVIIGQRGEAVVLVPCGEREIKSTEQEIDALSGGMIRTKMLTVVCRNQYLKTTYRFKSKILVVDDSDSIEFGSALTGKSKLGFANDRFQLFTEAEFRALSKTNNIRVAGEPVLRLVEGSETMIESGGEFPVIGKNSDADKVAETTWKQYGLVLKVKAMSESDKNTLVHIDFAVRTPGGGSYQNNLQLNRLVSVVRAELGKPLVVGGVEIETGDTKEQSVPYLSLIPIIGPLFKLVSKERGHSKLFLWIVLDHENAAADPARGLAKFSEIPGPE
jgi:hypothetical protein